MRKLLTTLLMTLAVLLGSVGKSFALPECEGSPLTGTPTDTSSWDNCEGIIIYNLSGFVGDKYVGEYRNAKYHGQGTFTYARSGNKFVGEWKDGKKNGQGAYNFADGRVQEGIWANGKFIGKNPPQKFLTK